MRSTLSFHVNCGLPFSVSGITHQLPFSKELADHNRRRRSLKKVYQVRMDLHSTQRMEPLSSYALRRRTYCDHILPVNEIDHALAMILQDLACPSWVAKAA